MSCLAKRCGTLVKQSISIVIISADLAHGDALHSSQSAQKMFARGTLMCGEVRGGTLLTQLYIPNVSAPGLNSLEETFQYE